MTDNPYQASSSRIPTPRVRTDDAPEDIRKHIRHGVIAAAISGTLTLVITVVAMAMGSSVMGLSVWSLTDVVLIFGLAYGIHRKSRVCAVMMLLYFIASKIIQMADFGAPGGFVLSLLFLYYYAMAVVGTFRYHAWRRDTAAV